MIIRCPSCSTGFELPDEVLGDGRKVRCNQCQNVWFATPGAQESEVKTTLKDSEADEAAANGSESDSESAESGESGETDQPEEQDGAPDGSAADSNEEGGEDSGEDGESEDDSGDGPDDGSEASGDEDGEEDHEPGEGSLSATLAAIKEEAAEEDFDADDEDEIGEIEIDGDDDALVGEMSMSRPVMIGWIALPVFLIIVFASFFIFHDSISKAWPPSNQLYNLVGMGESSMHESEPESANEQEAAVIDPREYISMEYSARVSELADGTPALLVQGTITNSADFDVDLAPMRGILRNRLNQSIHEWDFEPPDSHVGGGRVLPFTTSVADPPREMSGLEVFILWPEDR